MTDSSISLNFWPVSALYFELKSAINLASPVSFKYWAYSVSWNFGALSTGFTMSGTLNPSLSSPYEYFGSHSDLASISAFLSLGPCLSK